MALRTAGILLGAALIAWQPGSARADSICPPYPIFNTSRVETSGDVSLNLVQKIVGYFVASGRRIEETQNAAQGQQSSDPLVRLTVYIVQCRAIENSKTLSDPEKLDKLLQIFYQLGLNEPKRGSHLRLPVLLVAAKAQSVDDTNIAKAVSTKQDWQKTWFHRATNGDPLTSPDRYHVIVASPKGQVDAERAMDFFNQKYPSVYFELWQNQGSAYYAVTVGIGLTQTEAIRLRANVKQMGMDAFLWHWPKA